MDIKDNKAIMDVVNEQYDKHKNGSKTLHWTKEEDEYLMKALAKYGLKNWDHVCGLLPYRTYKAVQVRWFNYLATLPHDHMKKLRAKYHDSIKKVTNECIQKKRDEKAAEKA